MRKSLDRICCHTPNLNDNFEKLRLGFTKEKLPDHMQYFTLEKITEFSHLWREN